MVFSQRATDLDSQKCWRPSADIHRTRTGWLLKFELAGVRPEDVVVEAAGSCLKVSGSRRDWLVEEDCTYHSMEISYSRFERIVELPCNLEGGRVEAECRHGILVVRVTTAGEEA